MVPFAGSLRERLRSGRVGFLDTLRDHVCDPAERVALREQPELLAGPERGCVRSPPLTQTTTTTAATTANDLTHRPLAEIRRALYGLFATYGKVLDVVHVRSPKTRGTAFVVFRDLASSTAAMRGLDGESFYGKSLVSGHSRPLGTLTLTLTPDLRPHPRARLAADLVREIDFVRDHRSN